MFTVTYGSDSRDIRNLSSAVFYALAESDDRDDPVTLAGESHGCVVRAVYRRGARVEFECRDADGAAT